jgi:DNA polymerase III gamma/tau subunit
MSEELYKKYRPKTFKEIKGQDEAVNVLRAFDRAKKYPRALLFSGPSGTGKTTLARIVRDRLGCGIHDFTELDSATFRGIDSVREIRQNMHLAPISGTCRVWLIDECHKWTNDAQNAMLKTLEDTPRHVYFMLATTDPGKLIKPIITRCTEVRVKPVQPDALEELVGEVAAGEKVKLSKECVARIAEVADGSPRKALVLLQQVVGIDDDAERIKVILSNDVKQLAISIARAMFDNKPWPQVAALLQGCEEEPEGIRQLILKYASSVLLKSTPGNDKAFFVLQVFRDNWFDCGRAGLVMSCYEVCKAKK